MSPEVGESNDCLLLLFFFLLVFSFLFLFSLTVNSCSLPFTRYDGLDGEEDESDTVGMRSGRVDCSLIWASCGVLEIGSSY